MGIYFHSGTTTFSYVAVGFPNISRVIERMMDERDRMEEI